MASSKFRKFFRLERPQRSESPQGQAPQGESLRPNVDALYGEATQAYQAKDLSRAISLYDRVVALQPDHAEAYYKRGNAFKDLGQMQAALASYDAAIQHRPDFQYAWCNRGFVQQCLGLQEAALFSFDRAIELNPDDIIAQSNRGLLLLGMSRWQEALASQDRVLALNPQLLQTWIHRGNVLRELRQLEAALASYRKALELQPDCAEAHYNSGVLLELMEQPEASLASYELAIESYPQFHQAHYNRAGVLKATKHPELALGAYEKAIAIKSDYPEAHANRGAVLHELERWDEALASYELALALRPDFAEAHCQRAYTFGALGRYLEALADYNRAVALRPDFPEARWNRSMTMLLLGDYANGWVDYEWRWRNPAKSLTQQRLFTQPLWLGEEPIAGKRLLVHCEQGLGDTLQFCRFAKSVADRGATVFLEVQPPLATLLQRLDGVSQVIVAGGPLPDFDYHCPVMSLPLALKTTLDTIPGASGYLSSDPAKVSRWRSRLGERTRLRVGLVWSGNPRQVNDHKRSFRLARWIEQLPRDFQYVCLQKDIRPEDRETLAATPWISTYDEELGDFDNTGALCECLDVVISVCTSIAHLSGGLGRPTWVLLPFDADWRWLHARDDSPWYQSVRLYRQQVIGDWDGVFARVAADLRRIGVGKGLACLS